jgi:hypothetical protein
VIQKCATPRFSSFEHRTSFAFKFSYVSKRTKLMENIYFAMFAALFNASTQHD